MAFNNGYPQYYPPNYPPNYMQGNPQNYVPSNNSPQIQNGGLISVPSEDVARNYPVGPGNSITFKNENAPYVYTKTMGFSQLDRPIFEKYRLVREEDVRTTEVKPEESGQDYADKLRDEISRLQDEIDSIWGVVNDLKDQLKKSSKRKDDSGD